MAPLQAVNISRILLLLHTVQEQRRQPDYFISISGTNFIGGPVYVITQRMTSEEKHIFSFFHKILFGN